MTFLSSTRRPSDDTGSIILALLGIIILTTVATVGLATVVNGQKQSRHDNTFATALTNAQSGLDTMATYIKNNPESASVPALNTSGSKVAPAFTTTATAPSGLIVRDGTGAVTSRTWLVTSTGTATLQGRTVTRIVREQITIGAVYTTPLYAQSSMTLGGASGISEYCPPGGGPNCSGGATPQSAIPLSSLLGNVDIAAPLGTPGAAAVGNNTLAGCTVTNTTPSSCGTLSVSSSGASGFSQIAIDNPAGVVTSGAAADCSDASACTGSAVVAGNTPPPVTDPCSGLTGASVLGLPTIGLPLSGLGLIFNANVNTNLLGATTGTAPLLTQVCSSLPVIIPTVAVDLTQAGLSSLVTSLGLGALSGVAGLLGSLTAGADLGTLNVPLNFSTCSAAQMATLTSQPPAGTNTQCPNTQLVNIYAEGTNTPVIIGTSTNPNTPTVFAGTITDLNGPCTITGNVILYGTLNCKTVTVAPGSSLTIYYNKTLGKDNSLYTIVPSNFTECTKALASDC